MTEEPKYTNTVTGLTELMCGAYTLLSYISVDGTLLLKQGFLIALEEFAKDVRKFDIENDR